MPPPTTLLGEVRHRSLVAHHYTMLFLGRNAESVASFARLMIFLLKMATLARPCWPYMINWGLGATLVAVAGMDLGLPRAGTQWNSRHAVHGEAVTPFRAWWDWKVSFGLLAIHFFALRAASRWHMLCPVAQQPWADWG
jgi:hypothetical protein